MKASELIKQLQEAIEAKGDYNVMFRYPGKEFWCHSYDAEVGWQHPIQNIRGEVITIRIHDSRTKEEMQK